jgi:DNA-binding GntR family transcriptional regulator
MKVVNGTRGKSEAVYQELKDLVKNYRFGPGEPICIFALSERLAVSITPIREALARLHSEALVEAVPNRGFFVPPLDEDELSQLYEVGQIVLRHCLLNAEKRKQNLDNIKKHLSTIVDSMPQLPSSQMKATVIEQLYEQIAKLEGNSILGAMVRNFNDRTHYLRVIDFDLHSRQIESDIKQILGQLKVDNVKAAVKKLERHWSGTTRRTNGLVKEGIIRAYQRGGGEQDRRGRMAAQGPGN